MPIISFFDTETTGIDPEKGNRIIEIAIICYDFDTQKEKLRFIKRLNPGVAIEPKAQLVHGIRQVDLIGEKQFRQIEPAITKLFSSSDLVVAHNIDFDLRFLVAEYGLLKKDLPDAQGFCTMENARWATSNGKLPNLGELCYACEVDYDPSLAHAAEYDVLKTAECFFFAIKHDGYSIEGFTK